MSVFPDGKDFIRNYLLTPVFDPYKNEKGAYNISSALVADITLQLIQDTYRYDTSLKSWWKFNGQRWVEYLGLISYIRMVANDIKKRCEMPENKGFVFGHKKIHNDRFVFSVVNLLVHEQSLHILPEDFDKNQELLNTPAGTVNLRTGQMQPHQASDLLKNITNVSPLDDEEGYKCSNYLKHLSFMTQNDVGYQLFLEKLSGYCLTGQTFMEQFYWLFGPGSNGKSALIETWVNLMGDYAGTTTGDHFAFSAGHHAMDADAKLKGKRLVYIDELSGNRFDAPKLKRFTTTSARIMCQEKFTKSYEYTNTAKLIFCSNHKPKIDGSDGGFSRRLQLCDFIVSHPVVIKNFQQLYLDPEASYILNRMIKNATKVLSDLTIETPDTVKEASQDYLDDNNVFKDFIDEAFDKGKHYSAPYKAIKDAFRVYCVENGLDVQLSDTQMGNLLNVMGYKKSKSNNIRLRLGLQLKPSFEHKYHLGTPKYDG